MKMFSSFWSFNKTILARLLSISIMKLDIMVYSRDNLPRIKDGTYIINFDDKQSKRTHWVSLFIDRNTAVYFDSFGNKYILQDDKIKDKSITHNIFRIKSDDTVT